MARLWLFKLLLIESLVQQSCDSFLLDRLQLSRSRHDDPPEEHNIDPSVSESSGEPPTPIYQPTAAPVISAPVFAPVGRPTLDEDTAGPSSPVSSPETAEPSSDIEDEETPQPSSPVSPPSYQPTAAPVILAPVFAPIGRPTLDEDMSGPSSPVSSPVANDPEGTSQPTENVSENDLSQPSAPVSSPVAAEMTDPEVTAQPTNIDMQPATPFGWSDGEVPTPQPADGEIPTAEAPVTPTADSQTLDETEQPVASAPPGSPSIMPTAGTSAAADSSQWLTSRGAILVENGFASFSSALSGDGSTIALEYKDEQDNSRVQAHRYGPDGSWMEQGSDITGIRHVDDASHRLALSGDGNILAVGFPVENCNIGSLCGLVRVYTYEADDWRQLGDDIVGETSFGYFGLTVDISDDGMTVAAGAPFSHGGSGNHVGKVRMFQYDTVGGRWEQLGTDLEGDAALDYAGSGVALSADGTVVAYGALQNEAGGLGYVKVFAYDESMDSFAQLGEKIEGGDSERKLGSAVALSSDGSTLVVGAVIEGGGGGDGDEVDSSSSFGVVSVFRNESDAWVKIGDDIESGSMGDMFGFSVAMSADGNRVVIGAPGDDSSLGSVSVFDLNDGTWALQGQPLQYTNAEVGGVSYEVGRSVGISSSGLVVSTGGWFGVEVFEVSSSRASKPDFGSSSFSSLTTGSVTASPTMASPPGSPTAAPITSPSVTIYRASVADEVTRRRQPRSHLHN